MKILLRILTRPLSSSKRIKCEYKTSAESTPACSRSRKSFALSPISQDCGNWLYDVNDYLNAKSFSLPIPRLFWLRFLNLLASSVNELQNSESDLIESQSSPREWSYFPTYFMARRTIDKSHSRAPRSRFMFVPSREISFSSFICLETVVPLTTPIFDIGTFFMICETIAFEELPLSFNKFCLCSERQKVCLNYYSFVRCMLGK